MYRSAGLCHCTLPCFSSMLGYTYTPLKILSEKKLLDCSLGGRGRKQEHQFVLSLPAELLSTSKYLGRKTYTQVSRDSRISLPTNSRLQDLIYASSVDESVSSCTINAPLSLCDMKARNAHPLRDAVFSTNREVNIRSYRSLTENMIKHHWWHAAIG
ncbi:hypothetical protein M3J09_013056 [Ascochyta lentis]